jgi:chemotaxis-related protein WspD
MTLMAPAANILADCWNQIGVWGDQTCPELQAVVHCHNCPVFASASRRFLDAPSPDGYVEEWTERLIAPSEEAATDLESVLIFRLAEEWLALPVQVLIEVTLPRAIHRIPHRTGLLAGIVNIRGELHLCIHLAQLLGIKPNGASARPSSGTNGAAAQATLCQALIVVEREGNRWVFPVDQVDQVYRFSTAELTATPPTLARAAGRLTKGVFAWQERSIGYLDDARLFQVLRTQIR